MAIQKRTRMETHVEGVDNAADRSIEHDLPSRRGPGRGIDLIYDGDKTALVRASEIDSECPLMTGSLDSLKADYLIIATGLRYTYHRKLYIMTMDEAKKIAVNDPFRCDGSDNWFISRAAYRQHENKFDVLKE